MTRQLSSRPNLSEDGVMVQGKTSWNLWGMWQMSQRRYPCCWQRSCLACSQNIKIIRGEVGVCWGTCITQVCINSSTTWPPFFLISPPVRCWLWILTSEFGSVKWFTITTITMKFYVGHIGMFVVIRPLKPKREIREWWMVGNHRVVHVTGDFWFVVWSL